jgi:hypothetical protein
LKLYGYFNLDSVVADSKAVDLLVFNVNRVPSAIKINNDSSSTIYSINLDGKQQGLVAVGGGTYTNSISNTELVDVDTTNDKLVLSFMLGGKAMGTFDSIAKKWSFKLPKCLKPGSGIVTLSPQATGSDGRGGSINRNINITVRNAIREGVCVGQ